MPSTRSGSSGTLLTLDRGIRVLEEIARGNGLGTARSIGATLGINQGTVYQILRTLQDSGYVHRQPGGRYQLGARIAYLVDGYQIQAAPPQVIIDFLHTLHHSIDETVYAASRARRVDLDRGLSREHQAPAGRHLRRRSRGDAPRHRGGQGVPGVLRHLGDLRLHRRPPTRAVDRAHGHRLGRPAARAGARRGRVASRSSARSPTSGSPGLVR